MPHNDKDKGYLWDIKDACNDIQEFIKNTIIQKKVEYNNSMEKKETRYDSAYKYLFSNKRIFHQFLTKFVHLCAG